MEESAQFQENVKNSFDLVKKHNLCLEAEIKAIKADLAKLKEGINTLTNTEKRGDKRVPQEIIGWSPTTDDRQQTTTDDTSTTMHRQQITEIPLSQLKKDIESTFSTLTDRELSVFLALYNIDNEKKGDVSYFELSQRLNITESTVRDFINQLIRKGAPIEKNRFFNRKASLSIKNEFKTLGLYKKLLKLKISKTGQKTLFDL